MRSSGDSSSGLWSGTCAVEGNTTLISQLCDMPAMSWEDFAPYLLLRHGPHHVEEATAHASKGRHGAPAMMCAP